MAKIKSEVDRGGYIAQLVGPFRYRAYFQNLAVSQQASDQDIQIQANSDFLWMATSYQADIAQGLQTRSSAVVPLCLAQLSLVNNPFQNAEAPLCDIAGGPVEGPRMLEEPFWLDGGDVFTVSLRNYATAGTIYNVYVSLIGFRYQKKSTGS